MATSTSGSFGGDLSGFGGSGTLANVFDPFNLWHSNPASYTTLPGASKYTSEQQQLMQQLLQWITPYAANPSSIPSYSGQLAAPLSPTQTTAIGNLTNLSDPGSSGANDILSQIMKFSSGQNYNSEYMRNAFKEGIEKPLVKNFKEDVMPELNSSYAKSGNFYGSDRGKATEDKAQTLMDALSMGRSSLESSIYSTGQSNQLQGITDFGNFISQQGGLNNTLMSAGNTEQATTQNALTQAYQQWAMRNVPGMQPMDTLLTAILNMYPQYDSTTLTQGADNKSGQAGGIAGIISSIFG
jgi:hypothetical protein